MKNSYNQLSSSEVVRAELKKINNILNEFSEKIDNALNRIDAIGSTLQDELKNMREGE